MRFGIMGFCTGPYDEQASRVRFAEDAGFDSAWVDDDIDADEDVPGDLG